MREERLDSSARIKVWTAEEDFNPERPNCGPGLLAVVVRGIVPQEDRVLLPAWRLGVQHLHQRVEEQRDDVRVGVGVAQREPRPALIVEGGNHG